MVAGRLKSAWPFGTSRNGPLVREVLKADGTDSNPKYDGVVAPGFAAWPQKDASGHNSRERPESDCGC